MALGRGGWTNRPAIARNRILRASGEANRIKPPPMPINGPFMLRIVPFWVRPAEWAFWCDAHRRTIIQYRRVSETPELTHTPFPTEVECQQIRCTLSTEQVWIIDRGEQRYLIEDAVRPHLDGNTIGDIAQRHW